MIRDSLLLLVMLNPFATMLYLTELMRERSTKEFSGIYLRASIFTFVILVLFAITGDFILDSVFQVGLPAVRIFGGITIFMAAYTYLMHGPEGIKLFKGDVTTIAQRITLPFLVGPGSIWVSIHIGRTHSLPTSFLLIFIPVLINALGVAIYLLMIKSATRRRTVTRILNYFEMAMRLNALLIGAVSVQMILSGIRDFLNT